MAVIDPADIMYTNFEPVQKNRFICVMEGIPSYMISKIKIPTIEHGEVVLDHINLKRYVKGRTSFSDCAMSLYQPIVPSGAQMVMDWSRLQHEEVTGRDGYADFYKRDLQIQILDPVGAIVGQWILKGAFIKSADFGEYDWTGEGLVMIDLNLRIDSAVLNY